VAHVYGIDAAGEELLAGAGARVRAVASAAAADVDGKGRFPEEARAALAKERLLGLTVDAAHGGLGRGPADFCAVVEELATVCGSAAMVYVMHVAATAAIAASGTLGDRDALLRSIAKGEHLSTLAFSEAGSRSQFWVPMSRLAASGDGFTTSAAKSWVTSAARADSYVSTALDPAGTAPTLHLVRKGTAGARISGGFSGLGLRGNDSAPVALEGMKVAKGDLVSPLAGGVGPILEVVLPWFAMGTSAMANGLCRGALAATIAHVQGAGFVHTGTKLRDLPQIRARIAQMSVSTELSRSLLGRTLAAMGAGAPDTPLLVLQARLAALDAAVEVTDLAMKACGGAAFSRQLGVERLFRDARAGWVMAPTVDHLHDFVGRALTGLPLFG
jgi:alkylation response protein AidB-like acyl-CoA dehydrogenase